MLKLTLQKPDTLGAFASLLCFVHCLVTPLLFVAQASCITGDCLTKPSWWGSLDYIFLVLSFFAVARSAKQTSKGVVKPLLWGLWLALFVLIINEKNGILEIPEIITYIVTLSLIVVHIYSLKYCQCQTDKCFVSNLQ